MSGIAAVVSLDRSGIPEFDVERMANVLKKYGPDRQKILKRGNAVFLFCLQGHTPEHALESQPVVLDDRFVLLFDGRIDNRCELGNALGIVATELHSTADSVLAVRSFARWGEGAFGRLLGDFAVLVMDLQDGTLIGARDHMGLRVLHYHRCDRWFAIATAPDALFALSWVPRVLNQDKVGDTLVQRGLNGETTYFREINRVLPGSLIRVRGDAFSKHSFWSPESSPDVRFKTDEEYVEAFKEHLDNAVSARMRSCRVPCATITGGLDSSSVAVVAADMLAASGQKLNTYTAVPEAGFFRQELRGGFFDERPYVRKIVEANPNIVPHFIPSRAGPILDQIEDQIRMGGAPSGSIVNGLWVMDIFAAARQAGHDVMLTGEMGNITMSYHGRGLFPELLRTGRLVRLFVEIAGSGYRWQRAIRTWTLAPFVPAPLFRKYKQWRRGDEPPWHWFSFIHPEFAARSGVVDRAAREYLSFDAPTAREARQGRINEFHCFSEAADWFTQLRARFGIDVRTPAFDKRLFEFCIGIPTDQYLHQGCDRWLIRRAMKGRLPDTVLYNKKRGVQAADWHPRLTREIDTIASKVRSWTSNSDVASVVDLQRLSATLENWPERQPSVFSAESDLLSGVPQALGAAYFIESITGAN